MTSGMRAASQSARQGSDQLRSLNARPPCCPRLKTLTAAFVFYLTKVGSVLPSQMSARAVLRQVELRAYRHWIMKSEGESRIEDGHDMRFSVADLANCPRQTTSWDGVRNHVASRHLGSMRPGDQCLFYHSNCKKPGCVALIRVVTEPYPDHTAWDKTDPHYDAKCPHGHAKWTMVCVCVRVCFCQCMDGCTGVMSARIACAQCSPFCEKCVCSECFALL
jgi:predicted RNA-binding protein with PUA-like domain